MEVQHFLLHAWPQSGPILCHSPVAKGTRSSRTLGQRPGDAAELGKRRKKLSRELILLFPFLASLNVFLCYGR